MSLKFKNRDEVIVYDSKRQYIGRGTVCGVSLTAPPIYNVQPKDTLEMTDQWTVQQDCLRHASGEVDRMIKAYSNGVPIKFNQNIDDFI